MDPNDSAAQEDSRYSAILRPHRSLGPTGFLVLMGLIGAASFIAGMVFLLIGAWPVFGFFGLDLVLIYWAFKLNYRSGRLYELVDLRDDTLTLTRVQASGRRHQFAFNPYWVRVQVDEGTNGQAILKLVSHGKELSFGRFLNDDEKREFAAELAEVLRANKASFGV